MRLRLRQIAIIVEDIDAVASDFHAIFGLNIAYREETMPVGPIGMQNRILPVGTQFIELVSPVRPGVTGARYLERRQGDGGYMVICQTDDRDWRDRQVAALGIRTVGGRDSAAYSFLQFHPKDTGGSFLEIDWHEGYDDALPGWTHAAGADWAPAVNTDVIDRIVAAEIQSPSPDATAARWATILDLPVTRDELGRAKIDLDGGIIRFVVATDGRGEGLGGLDIHASDGRQAMTTARMRGLRTDGATIRLGGMRLTLV